ncbi:hypothetical protein BO78DRAFT_347226 [Aspergillus sclerotiicarbonarius CBS 121057]|uniref:Uncharacterized protein n=1 Tax=Aspergillus sclerotiicarbonarius (strain CBS 121057 / IBT 28362) TaxID=1448318 RepID=A0A319E3K3_ASPSB|nr:hypothetical protein BO78DRAFT_347226 [Aspergillus sclerotiicarbonarius CBS 121057]
MACTPLTDKSLLRQPLPDLRIPPNKYRTRSSALHDLWYLQELSQWDIEREARLYCKSVDWEDKNLLQAMEKERLYCGDEHSVVGRFNQNLCHSILGILQKYVEPGICFGDWKCASSDAGFGKVPDVVLITGQHDLLVVGEAKTPWMHDIDHAQSNNVLFRQYLGQIANYMYTTKSRLGWFTTYEQTMFLKQVPHPKRKERWVLCHSPVIRHDVKYQEIPKDSSILHRGRVTLRECFLFLAKEASESPRAVNTMKPLDWVTQFQDRVDDEDDKYISLDEDGDDSDSGVEASHDRDSSHKDIGHGTTETSSDIQQPQRRQIATRSSTRREQATVQGSLQAATERLSIGEQSDPFSALEWKFQVKVFFDKSQERWYYKREERKVYVELNTDPDKGEFFVHDGFRHPVKKEKD